jgi:hypothetical protein
MMTDEQIANVKAKLEGAFRPLTCKAEDWDYKEKMRFKVLDGNHNAIFENPKITQHDVESSLAEILEQARAEIQAKGLPLT